MKKQDFFCLDGTYYDVSVRGLTISTEKIANDNSGRLKKTLEMWLKYDGIFLNYQITLGNRTEKEKEYFKLFDKLSFDQSTTVSGKPKQGGIHTVKFPYGNKMYEFQAYCSGTSIDITHFNGQDKWDKYGEISISFIAINPAATSSTSGSPIL